MPRTILITVGISLIADKVDDKEVDEVGFGNLGGSHPTLRDLGKSLRDADDERPENFQPQSEGSDWHADLTAVSAKLQELWAGPLAEKHKRAYSGAELASLHLLGKHGISDPSLSALSALSANDTIMLLASDTPSGIFCAETIADALRTGVFPGVVPQVATQKIEGLRADNADLFLSQGLPNAAKVLTKHRTESLLIASGGYKGLMPYFMPLCMELKLPLLYLYEDSDRLMELAPLNLWQQDGDYDLIFQVQAPLSPLMSTGVARTPADQFWTGVINAGGEESKERLLARRIVEEFVHDGHRFVRLTSTGVLAKLVLEIRADAENR